MWEDRLTAEEAKADEFRSAFDIDYGRVIHSASFRRLQNKTQILNIGDSDFYRTRLTHSLEVSQIGTGILRQLHGRFPDHEASQYLPSDALMQTICLVHDLGHPPFGHGGELALNYCMRDDGGFEGNGHSLRLLTKLEAGAKANGANLSRRSLLGILKYPVKYRDVYNAELYPVADEGISGQQLLNRTNCKPPKCYMDSEADVVSWILSAFSESDRKNLQKLHQQRLGNTAKVSINRLIAALWIWRMIYQTVSMT